MPARTECAVLLAMCALLYLTGLGDVPFYTRGEPREGNVVREMLRTERWLVPQRPEGEPARKPPLYYWTAALAWLAAPEPPEYALRLPSAAFATAGVIGTWAVVRLVFGRAVGWPAALILATAFEWTRAAVSARVDMALAAGTTAVFLGWVLLLARGPDRVRLGLVLSMCGAVMGTLAKGPVAIILPAIAVLGLALWERDGAIVWRLRAPWVLGCAVVVAVVWYAAAIAQEGPAYLDVLVRENLLRFVDTEKGHTGHQAPTWYLFAVGAVGFLPWTGLLPLGLGYRSADPMRAQVVRFAKVWAGGTLLFFSLASAKRSVYLLPLFPALALLVGAGVVEPPAHGRWVSVTRTLAWCISPALLVLGGVAVLYAVGIDPSLLLVHWLREDDRAGAATLAAAAASHRLPLAALGVATIGVGLWLVRIVARQQWPTVVTGVAALMIGWVVLFDGLLHPAIGRSRSLRDFMVQVAAIVPASEAVHAIYPPDPGLRFYAPRPLQPWPREGVPRPAYLLVWEDEWRTFADGTGEALRPVAVSEAQQPGRGHLVLVSTPGGPLRRVSPPASDRPPGLRAPPT